MYDAIIIGAGVVGCAVAQQMAKYNGKLLVVDRMEDVADGASKANSGIVHAGFDAHPGTEKARLNVKGSMMYGDLAKELGVPYTQPGALVLGFSEEDRATLNNLLAQAQANNVPGCRIVEHDEILQMEPNTNPAVVCALYAPTSALVSPYEMTCALADSAAENGAAKIRINPGNIGGEDRVKAVVEACGARHIPIRIGVNGGSLEPRLLEKYGRPTPEALVESAFGHIALLEKYDFHDICVSMKSSSVPLMIEAYRLFSERSDYPLHVGVTETGTEHMGILKSAMGIGALLCQGIGDTMRVSLTADPVREVLAAKDILKAAGLRRDGVNIIACPTCGRTRIDLIGLANQVEQALADCKKPLTVAVMGCVVNGPGEAREADIGIAGGDGCGILFVKGRQLKKLPYDELLPALLDYIEHL